MDRLDKESVEEIKTWLSNRQGPSDDIDHYQTNVLIHPSEKLRSNGFPDLHLSRYKSPQIKQMIPPIELHQLLSWMMKFLNLLRENRSQLETMELIRNGSNRRLARFQVQEAISIVQAALCCDVALELDTSCGGRGAEFVLVEESSGALSDILLRVCVCLFAYRPVRLICKAPNYNTSMMAAYLLDLMHESGANREQVQLLVQDLRHSEAFLEGAFSWRLTPASRKQTKLSTVSICFADADTSLAISSILEAYLRQTTHSPNLIVLVEESIYEQFLANWPGIYLAATMGTSANESHSLDKEKEEDKIRVDLNCIDMGLAHRMSGRCINVIKFRSTDELFKLINKLRKIPHTQLWTNHYLFAREFCLASSSSSSAAAGKHHNQLNNCNEFWLNHLPASFSGRRFHDYLIKYYRDSMKKHMDDVYSDILPHYGEEIERLRKLQATFIRKRNFALRGRQVLATYLALIHKFRSMKPASLAVNESLIRMKKFHLFILNGISELMNESRIETHLRPIGLAILVVKDKSCIKSKSVLIDFIFKNLLLGNGVLLICAQALLGVRFPMSLMSQYNLPFAMVDPKPSEELIPFDSENVEAELSSSWGESSEDSGLNASRVVARPQLKCPKAIYSIEFGHGKEIEAERVNGLVVALGGKRRTIWYPDGFLHCAQTLIPEQMGPDEG